LANYVKATNFAVKDSLASGNPAKIVKGTEIDTEFNAIASAIASKTESDSPTFTGTPLAPTASTATNNTQIASTAYVVNRIAQDIAEKAPLASPTFTGTPAAPTASAGTNTTQIATTAFVTSAITTERTATGTITGKTISGASNTLTVRLDQSDTTGTLPVSKGGTGATTHTANNVLVGNGTSAITSIAPGTSGNALVSNGTTWSSGSPAKLSTASGSAPSYSARAWANIWQSQGSTIRASGNVSSFTANGSGDFTINFTTAMPDTNYAVVTSSSGNEQHQALSVGIAYNVAPTTGACRMYISTGGGVGSLGILNNAEYVCVAFFR
jgi:hypothetical protein